MKSSNQEKISNYIDHLQHFIRFPTISDSDDREIDFRAFSEFHEYLRETYPNIHKRFTREVIGRASLLYHFTSRQISDKRPVLLMAHQDVVPVGDAVDWTYPPFSGKVHDGSVYGRGAADCKNVILSELESLEQLLSEGFEPDYDVYLAYSYNEEVQSEHKGAKEIADTLLARGIRLGAVFDEGSGPKYQYRQDYKFVINTVMLGEKASQDYEIYALSEGGHSMMPGDGTALGRAAAAVARLEDHPFPFRLIPLVREELKSRAQLLEGELQKIYEDPDSHFEELKTLAQTDKELDSLLHTTVAITQAYGSERSNILPRKAGFIVNVRLLEGDTSETVLKHFKEVLPDGIEVRKINGDEPWRSTEPHGKEYKLIKKAIANVYNVDESSVLNIPSYLAGGTDSRYFRGISDHVFMYSGILNDGKSGGAHGYDEHFSIETIDTGIRFFTEYLKLY